MAILYNLAILSKYCILCKHNNVYIIWRLPNFRRASIWLKWTLCNLLYNICFNAAYIRSATVAHFNSLQLWLAIPSSTLLSLYLPPKKHIQGGGDFPKEHTLKIQTIILWCLPNLIVPSLQSWGPSLRSTRWFKMTRSNLHSNFVIYDSSINIPFCLANFKLKTRGDKCEYQCLYVI